MSSDASDDTTHHPTPPSLNKAEPSAPAAPASIWEPLDGSAPRLPEPTYRLPPGAPSGASLFPGRAPGQEPPPPQHVAAVYAQTAQAAPTFTLAGWWDRCWAFLIDTVLFGVVVIALTLLAGSAAGMTIDQATNFFASGVIPKSVDGERWLYAVLVAGRLLLGLIPALFLVRWNGQTPGKRMIGLRVMRASGEPMTWRVALRREVMGRVVLLQLAAIVTLGIGPALNYLWPLWDPQRRAGHDLYASTRVIREAAKR